MKIQQNNNEKLSFFRDLYTNASNANADVQESLNRAMEQYRGSLEIDGSQEKALTVRNITYEIIESQVSSDIPMPKADPTSYSEGRSRNAEAIERLLRALRNQLPFEEMNDMDERYTYIYGGSVWYAEWDNSKEYQGEVGGVNVYCLSPRDFIGQPGIYTIQDMEYCFLRFTTTRGELQRKYNVSDEDISSAECEYEYNSVNPDTDAVTLITCFYKDDEGEVGRFIFSGDLILSDIPKYYKRKSYTCNRCGNDCEECTCDKPDKIVYEEGYEELSADIFLKNGVKIPRLTPRVDDGGIVLEKTRIPYYTPKCFPIVIRKNTSCESSLLGQSDCDYIRPQQQAINKIESRILMKLLRAGITPVMPEDASVAMNNSVFGQVIKMKPGESTAQYGKVDTTPDISQDIAEAERLYNHAKRVLGITDAYLGFNESKSESGYAKQLSISQSSGRLESKRKMKNSAYAELDKIIFSLYLAFADEPRRLSYRDAYGRIHSEEFNRYSFIEFNIASGEYYYDDSYLFSVDLNGGAEYQRELLWQRNLENLKAGTLGDPTSPITLLRYWQCQERAHYPHARENVEYFLKETEKGELNNDENSFTQVIP